jgi:dTDP-L-rhamnose 4-epimerase
MRFLVTGGAGFIGSHIVDALLARGDDVRVLDTRPCYMTYDIEQIVGDVADAEVVRRAVAGVDAVCHQAAMVGLGLNIGDIADYVRNNDLGTAVLLRELAARRFAGRLVLASSMVVYGEGSYSCPRHGEAAAPPPRAEHDLAKGRFDPLCPDCGEPLTPRAVPEAARLDPRNVYAATKLQQEHLCFSFSRATGVPVTALRYHNVFGPRMPRDTSYAGVAAIFASDVAAGRPPRVFEDGCQMRDFVHVRDVANANVIALTRPAPAVGAFNVASGTPRTVGELATALTAAAGRDAPEPVVTGDYRLGDVRHVFASPERAATELGFRAHEDFEQGMAEFAAAYGPGREQADEAGAALERAGAPGLALDRAA